METMMYLCVGMIWIISGLFVAFLMVFSDTKQKELGEKHQGQWILSKPIFSSILILVVGGPISLLIGCFVTMDLIDSIKRLEKEKPQQ